MSFKTIPEMFIKVCDRFGNNKAAFKHKKDGTFIDITHQEFRNDVECFALGLLNLGIRRGDRIGIVSENRLEWAIADYAIACLGAVSVPIFPTLTAKQEEYIFSNCEVSAIVVSNQFQLNKVLEFKENLESLRQVIVMNENFVSKDVAAKSFHSIIDSGREIKPDTERKRIINEKIAKIQQDDILTLIYTSGTTGNPKGVMLTHRNIITNIKDSIEVVEFNETDELLSFLPWCHSYERTAGYYTGFSVGATIAIAESIESVGTNIIEIKPTLMTTVPKLLETINKKIVLNMNKESATKQRLFYWSIDVGRRYVRATQEGKMPIGLTAKYKIADRLVFSKIREKTGGRLKKFVSGGAALSPDVCEFFLAAGLSVLEGYGLTEAAPVVSVSRMNDIEVGTIGKPLPSEEVRFAPDGELLCRGPNVMKGYWNDEEATLKAIDDEGWLYTGDIGEWTARGNIKITDRKKHIIVNSGGKNIAPQPIENLLSQSIFINHVVIIGDKRDFVSALITPDFDQLKNLAESMKISYKNDTELISNEFIVKAIKNDIDRLQQDLAKYERVRKFSLLSQPFSVENGELTPKMSIKRHVVERKYSDLIDQMYGLK
jgi:long-chain acyl-CoA synthetase